MIRERALRQRREEEELAAAAEEEEEDNESEYTSEYTTDDEEDDLQRNVLRKPVFIPKAHRETLKEKERMEKENQLAQERKEKELEERRLESHELVAEEVRREMAAVAVSTSGPPDVDDTDGLNEEEEYEAWRLRELRRIKRDKQERESYALEQAEKERRRNMTDAEIRAENEKLRPKKEKSKLTFLQRYYHKGAFFQDTEEEVVKRDASAPTLEDRFDKTILPEVMQVKKFGRAGRTKWTHLANEDTTQPKAIVSK
ncbi:Microfibrillar-associated protein 1 [Quaeritorhiza haematococci]|nr:Microfibrillar-associated protein 1 [Quaeritorhiza haematococci]